MKVDVTRKDAKTASPAEQNRRTLSDVGVIAVSLLGGPGCGKTTLIDRTIERLKPHVRVGVIAGDPRTRRDADRIARHSEQVVQVNTGDSPCLDATLVRGALGRLDLTSLDLLFIENVGSLTVPAVATDLGQDAIVTVFSVAAGDDKAQKHSDLVRAADAVLLNKTDLFFAAPFDQAAFRDDVRRANPSAELFEVSALSGHGMNAWFDWLVRRVKHRNGCEDASHWFG
jgi:hydrogenase nickel incorporation protein HypB